MVIKLLSATYRLESLIAEDLFSYTYQGVQQGTQKNITLVKYKEELLSAKLVRELIQATDLLSGLKHSQLRPVLDQLYDGKNFYVVYDHSHTMTFEELIKRKTLSLSQIWQVCTKILSGLRYLESENIVHGNLNLRAISLSKSLEVKLSKVQLPLILLQQHLPDFPVIEDCIFYPPEMIQLQNYDSRSDIYAFGMMLYVCFSSQWPFPYSPKVADLKKSMLSPIKPFKPVSEKLPASLETVVNICLQKDPAKRFTSFSELIQVYQGKSSETVLLNQQKVSQSAVEKEIQSSLESQKKNKFLSSIKGAILSLSLLLLLASGYFAYSQYLTSIPSVIVPSVQNLTAQEAEIVMKKAKLKLTLGGERFHPLVESGRIIETKPVFGKEVKINRTVRYFVSKGKLQFLIPDLTGRSVAQAKTILNERQDSLEVAELAFSREYEKGFIIDQQPTPNSLLSPSENIKVVLSKGFPIKTEIKEAKGFFFQNKEGLTLIVLTLEVPEDWPKQKVIVYTTENGERGQRFAKNYRPGSQDTLRFEVPKGSQLEVYFNDELALKQEELVRFNPELILKEKYMTKPVTPNAEVTANIAVTGNVQPSENLTEDL